MTFDRWVACLAFIVCQLSFSTATAQTFTQRVQQSMENEGRVTIHHHMAIDNLVNNAKTVDDAIMRQQPVRPVKEKQQPEKHSSGTLNHPPTNSLNNSHNHTAEGEGENLEEVNVKRYKTTGYRVQVFRGGNSKTDRQRAEAAGAKMREAFPGEEVYIEFFAPDWTCRVGNFRDIEDARKVRDEARKMGFDAVTIVKGKIIVEIPQP